MATAHLVIKAASDFLATGGGDSLIIFERRTEDALGRAVEFDQKMRFIEEAKTGLRDRETSDASRLQVLLDFLDRQRRVIRGELS